MHKIMGLVSWMLACSPMPELHEPGDASPTNEDDAQPRTHSAGKDAVIAEVPVPSRLDAEVAPGTDATSPPDATIARDAVPPEDAGPAPPDQGSLFVDGPPDASSHIDALPSDMEPWPEPDPGPAPWDQLVIPEVAAPEAGPAQAWPGPVRVERFALAGGRRRSGIGRRHLLAYDEAGRKVAEEVDDWALGRWIDEDLEQADGQPETRTEYTYDDTGRLVEVEVNDVVTRIMHSEAPGQTTQVHLGPDAPYRVETQILGENGRVVEERVGWTNDLGQPATETSVTFFDAGGRPTREEGERGAVRTWAYDDAGRVVREVRFSQGRVEEVSDYRYELERGLCLILTRRPGRLVQTTRWLGIAGHILREQIGPPGRAEEELEYTYGANATPPRVWSMPGPCRSGAVVAGYEVWDTFHVYDALGREVEGGAIVGGAAREPAHRVERDAEGRVTLSWNPDGTSRWIYDESGRLIETTSDQGSDGSVESSETWLLDAEGRWIRHERREGGRLAERRIRLYGVEGDLLVEETDRRFDGRRGDLRMLWAMELEAISAGPRVTYGECERAVRDRGGNLVALHVGVETCERLVGCSCTVEPPRIYDYSCWFDVPPLVVHPVPPPGPPVPPAEPPRAPAPESPCQAVRTDGRTSEVIPFVYDAWGRVTRIGSGIEARGFAYDFDGRLRLEYGFDEWGGPEFTLLSYEASGRRLERYTGNETFEAVYEEAGRLVQDVGLGEVVHYSYDGQGRLIETLHLGRNPDDLRTTFSYDADGRLAASVQSWPDHPDWIAEETRRVYDPAGRLLTETGPGWTLTYDHRCRH